jgi:TolB-like protein/AraC-like DNA-binding protein/Tfp pilus assembly protein PilF
MAGYHINNQDLLDSLTSLILANLGNENFGARELARAAGMSQRKLSSRIRAIKSMSVSGFIREVRLQKAFGMLHEADLTAAEVAYKVGFGSATYFNKCFHEFFGFPPGKIRKEADNPVRVTLARKISGCLAGRFVSRRLIYSAGGTIILLLSIITVKDIFIKNSAAGDTATDTKNSLKSIAVLPFRSLNDSTEGRYFIDGLMDEIHTSLGRIHSLRVISRKSAEQFRGSAGSAPEISKRLKVDYLVTGSGQKYDNSYQLRVQLTDGKRDRQLWAESFEKEINSTKDIFEIQSQIAQAIAGELKATITPEEKQLIEKIPTANLTAYDLFQRGNDEILKHPFPEFNKESVKKAETFFRDAVKCDSTFALAYVGLAHIHWKRWDNDNSLLKNGDINTYLDSMFFLANKALSLDNQLPDAYRIRGEYYSVTGTAKRAIEEWNKALKHKPDDGDTYRTIGGFYEELDIVKSLEYFQKAAFVNHGTELIQTLTILGTDYYKAGFSVRGNYFLLEALNLDEDSIGYSENKITCMARVNGEYRKALEHFERRYLKDSANEYILLSLGYYNSLTGEDKEALKYYKKYLTAINDMDEYNTRLTRFTRIGYSYLKCGFKKQADYYYKKQILICKNRLMSVRPGEKIYWLYPLAGIYAAIGDKKKAYENLNLFNQAKSFTREWVTLLKTDPQFNGIRNESEFQRILKEVESKYQAEHERVRKWLEAQGQL